jgi:hypothetical protein
MTEKNRGKEKCQGKNCRKFEENVDREKRKKERSKNGKLSYTQKKRKLGMENREERNRKRRKLNVH